MWCQMSSGPVNWSGARNTQGTRRVAYPILRVAVGEQFRIRSAVLNGLVLLSLVFSLSSQHDVFGGQARGGW